jgi:hypothetical protein
MSNMISNYQLLLDRYKFIKRFKPVMYIIYNHMLSTHMAVCVVLS